MPSSDRPLHRSPRSVARSRVAALARAFALARGSAFAFALSLALALATTLLLPRVAFATPAFPGVVQQHLGLRAAPSCTLCHVGQTARGTVTTPFGTTMRSRGLIAYDEASVRTGLDALAAEDEDSDTDGVPDVRELREGTDPNASPGGEDLTPEYGLCSTSRPAPIDPSGHPVLVSLLLVSLLLFSLLSRRRLRHHTPPILSSRLRP